MLESRRLSRAAILCLALSFALPATQRAAVADRVVCDASSTRDVRFAPLLVCDGDWISRWQARDQREGAWVRATFASPRHLGAVILVDRANEKGLIRAVQLGFSDGSKLDYRLPVSQDPSLPQNGLLWKPLEPGPAPRPDKGAHFIRFAPRWTGSVKVTVTEVDPAPGNVSLAELRSVDVPEDDAQPIASAEEQEQMLRSSYALKATPRHRPWSFRNDAFALTVSNETGLITRMTSLQPTPVDVVGGGGRPGATLVVRNIDRDWEDRFSVLKAWCLGAGRDGGEDYQELTCIIAPAEHPVMFCNLRYRIFPDRVDLRIRFESMVEDWCRYRVGFTGSLDPSAWPEHRDTGFCFEPTATKWTKLFTHAYDICWEQGDWGSLVFPMGVLKRPDRYLLYGSFDLGPHMVFAPNVAGEGTVPNVYVMPLGLKRGDTFTLDLFLKTFPRACNEYLEVLQWYCRRTHWEEPALQGMPVRLTQNVARTLPPGKFVNCPFPGFRGDTPEKFAELRQWMLKTGATNLAYLGWDGWVHPPEELEGAKWSGYMPDLSTTKLRADIEELKRQGFHPFLYINNFVRPPWVPHENEGGRLFDPGNALEREWFIKRAQEAVRLLQPSGIFWDCGWWPLHYCSPNYNLCSDPRSDTLKGWLIIQARMYQWIKQSYPDMYVCTNDMAGGTPSQFFADAAMIEGGGIGTPQLVEDSRALMTAVVSYFSVFYYDIFPPVLQEHGLQFADVRDAGLPDAVRDDLWAKYMARGLKSVGLGGSLGGDPNTLVDHSAERRQAYPEYNGYAFYFPQARRTPELDRFCALANATPGVTSSFAVVTGVAGVYGSAWASANRLLVSLYNDTPSEQNLSAVLSLQVLRQHGLRDRGKLQAHVLDRNGTAVEGRTLKLRLAGEVIRAEGRLGAGELALIQTVGS